MLVVASLSLALLGGGVTQRGLALSDRPLSAVQVEVEVERELDAEAETDHRVPCARLYHAATGPSAADSGVRIPSNIARRSPLRDARRCQLKPGTENAHLVLFIAFSTQASSSDDEDLAGARTTQKGPSERPVMIRPAYRGIRSLRPVGEQPERPPRV